MRRLRCALALLCMLAFSALSSAQAQSLPSTGSAPEVSSPLSMQLEALATRLEQALSNSVTDWDLLSSTLTDLSSRLDRLATSSRALELESESTLASLKSLETSLKEADRKARHQALELKIWQGAAGCAALVAIGAIIWGAGR